MEMATHSSILTWEIPCLEEPSRLQSMESKKSQTWQQLNHQHHHNNYHKASTLYVLKTQLYIKCDSYHQWLYGLVRQEEISGVLGQEDHNKLWKIPKEMGIPDHLTCLLRNLYAGQEATVRAGHGPTDRFQIGTGVRQGCILSPCFFNFYAEYIMRNAGLEEAQPGIKIARRNINNLRYADDTTLMADSEKN